MLEGRQISWPRFVSLLALEQRDEEVVALSKGETKGKVPRWLTARLGYLCFRQEKVQGDDARGSYPLDKAIGLKLGQKATNGCR